MNTLKMFDYATPHCVAKEISAHRVICLSNESVSYEDWTLEEEAENENNEQ